MECDEENQVPSGMPGETAASMAQEMFKDDVDEAVKIGNDFSQYYYKIVSTKPHKTGELYLDNSVMIWDGNPSLGRVDIQCFFEHLPAMTFSVTTLDCQTMHSLAVGTKKTYIITTAGRYMTSGNAVRRQFTQVIVITADNDKWRIASDIFRTLEE